MVVDVAVLSAPVAVSSWQRSRVVVQRALRPQQVGSWLIRHAIRLRGAGWTGDIDDSDAITVVLRDSGDFVQIIVVTVDDGPVDTVDFVRRIRSAAIEQHAALDR